MLAKKLALDEAAETLDVAQEQMSFGGYDALPLDNLDQNIRCDDALSVEWPKVDVIVGNATTFDVDIGGRSVNIPRLSVATSTAGRSGNVR
jgi:hypothetical protein